MNNLKKIQNLPEKIEESFFKKIRKENFYLIFDKITINWLIMNKEILENALNHKIMVFLKKYNIDKIKMPDLMEIK